MKSVKGALEFLTAIGFIEDQSLNEKDEVETFLVLPEPNESLLLNALQELESGNCVSLKLFRDPKVKRLLISISIIAKNKGNFSKN